MSRKNKKLILRFIKNLYNTLKEIGII